MAFVGRKSGQGCYVYGQGKSKTVNEEAEKLLEKYRIPIKGRSETLQCIEVYHLVYHLVLHITVVIVMQS